MKLIKCLFASLIFFLWSCGNNSLEKNQEKNSSEVVFKQSLGGDISSTDPYIIQDNNAFVITLNSFEGLFRLNPENGLAEYGHIQDYKVSEDGLTYTFTLKDNLVFSDGTPITAQTFVDSWQRAIDPSIGSGMGYMFAHLLKNGDAIQKGELNPSDIPARAVDNKTLEVKLAFPAPYFKQILALPICVGLPTHLINSKGINWNKKYPLVSSGAYVITEWQPNNKVVIEKNPLYHDAKSVAITKIITYTTDDVQTAYNMYMNDEIDFLPNIPVDLIQKAKSHKDYRSDYYGNGNYYVLNTHIKPLDNIKIRKALAMTINRKVLVDQILGAGQKPLYGYIYKMINYPSKNYIEEDIKKAQQLLAEAGYPKGKGFPNLTLIYTTNDLYKKMSEFVQQEWKQKLGINVQLKNLEWKNFLATYNSFNYQVALTRWLPDYPDPLGALYFFDSRSGYNNYQNNQFLKILDESNYISNEGERMKKLSEAEKILMNDLPCIPVFTAYNNSLFNTTKWDGFINNQRNIRMYRGIHPKN